MPLALAVFALLLAVLALWIAFKQRPPVLAEEPPSAPVAARKADWLRASHPQPGTAGFTILAALNGIGCLGRSASVEPVFVLVGRDRAAAYAVRLWAAEAEKLGSRPEKVWEARVLADRMDQWRAAHGGGKIPD